MGDNVVEDGADAVLEAVRLFFVELDTWVPVLGDFLEMILEWPEGRHERIFDLAGSYHDAAQLYSDHLDEVNGYLRDLGAWQGDGTAELVREQLQGYFDELAGMGSALSSMQEMVQGKALEIESMKWMAIINLVMLGIAIVQMIITAWTGIGALVGAGEIAFTRAAISQLARRLLTKLWEQTIKAGVRGAVRAGVRGAVKTGVRTGLVYSGFILASKGGITLIQALEGHDPFTEGFAGEFAMEVVDGFIAGAIGGPLMFGVHTRLTEALAFGSGQLVDNVAQIGRDSLIDAVGWHDLARRNGFYSGMTWDRIGSSLTTAALLGQILTETGRSHHPDLAASHVDAGAVELFADHGTQTAGLPEGVRSPETTTAPANLGDGGMVRLGGPDLTTTTSTATTSTATTSTAGSTSTARAGEMRTPEARTAEAGLAEARVPRARAPEPPATQTPHTAIPDPGGDPVHAHTGPETTTSTPDAQTSDTQTSDTQTSDTQTSGTHAPDTHTSGTRSPGDGGPRHDDPQWWDWKKRAELRFQQDYAHAVGDRLGATPDGPPGTPAGTGPRLTPELVQHALNVRPEALSPYGHRLRSYLEQHFSQVDHTGTRRPLDGEAITAKLDQLRADGENEASTGEPRPQRSLAEPELAPSNNFSPNVTRTGADLPRQVNELVDRARANLLDHYPAEAVAGRVRDLADIGRIADRLQVTADAARAGGDMRDVVRQVRELSSAVSDYSDRYRGWRDFTPDAAAHRRDGEFADPGWRDLDGVDPLNAVEMANRAAGIDPVTGRFDPVDQAIAIAKIGDVLGPEFEAHATRLFERTIPMDPDSLRAALPATAITAELVYRVTVERPRGTYDPELGVTFVDHRSGNDPRSISAIAATVVHESMHALQPDNALLGRAIDANVHPDAAAQVRAQLRFEREYQAFTVQQQFLRGLAGFRSADPTGDPRIPNSDGYRELAARTPEQLRDQVLNAYIPDAARAQYGLDRVLDDFSGLTPQNIVHQARSAIIDSTHPVVGQRQQGNLYGSITRHVVATHGLDLEGVRHQQAELSFPALHRDGAPAVASDQPALAGHRDSPVEQEIGGSDPAAGRPAHVDAPHGEASTLRATDVDDALSRAAASRTPEGLVHDAVVTSLIDALPPIDGAPATTALTAFVSQALGQDVSLTPVGGGGAKGLSGAPVYLVRDESGAIVAVAKSFPKAEEYVRELSSLQRLQSPEFTRFTVPEPLALGVMHTPDGPAGVLVSRLAAGRSIDDLIADAGAASGADRARHLDALSRAVADTATALAELHTTPQGSGRPVAASYLDFHTGLARRLADTVLAQADLYEGQGGLRVDELSRRIDEAIAASREYPGRAALVHGDAHPGNFFWHPTEGVTFIDTPTFHYSVDDHGGPLASPERDVSNFEQRFAHYGRGLGLAPPEVERLLATFSDTYRAAGGAELDAGTLRMFGARSVLNKLLQVGDQVAAVGDGVDESGAPLRDQAIRDLKAEIGLLMRALEWNE